MEIRGDFMFQGENSKCGFGGNAENFSENCVHNAKTRKAIEDARNGIGLSKEFSSAAELMEDLNADDYIPKLV